MVEFCEKCGGMMLPSKEKGEKNLTCNLCDNKKPITENLIYSYKISKEISHQPGEEFKNLEKMKNWKKN
jgi:DNA-directed RNA polymerase subunit M/transcription elongation factor TFIIS